MNPPGSGAIPDRRRTYKTRKEAAVHGILDGTTLSKYRRTVLNKTLVAIMIGLFSFVCSETVLAVQRPPYPIKAEEPAAGHWVTISTNEETR